jgi:tetratricopeptide (TPR) repeat protein
MSLYLREANLYGSHSFAEVFMKFQEFIDQAWREHGTDAAGVASRMQQAIGLASDAAEASKIVHLAAHVFGEHLGKWDEGIAFLNSLRRDRICAGNRDCQADIDRALASLTMASCASVELNLFGLSDQIRIYASAAAQLSGQGNVAKASDLLKRALELSQGNLSQNDPAYRALAVLGNNLACTFEEKEHCTEEELNLMILAALTGRKFWEIAGNWLNVERAEYRLSMSYLKAGQYSKAFEHAQLCLEIVEKNEAEPIEFFFAYEALAKVEKFRSNHIGFSRAVECAKEFLGKIQDQGDKDWCQAALRGLLN